MAQNYDLEERTTRFSESVIELCKEVQKNTLVLPIINQLIRSSTSIGANYCEANGASSKKDFLNKIFICKREAKETQYWLRILTKVSESLDFKNKCQINWNEATELVLIFSKIASSSKGPN